VRWKTVPVEWATYSIKVANRTVDLPIDPSLFLLPYLVDLGSVKTDRNSKQVTPQYGAINPGEKLH
jgi:hypothetical protein